MSGRRSVRRLRKAAVAGLATGAIALALPGLASAATLHVEQSGTDDAGCGPLADPCASVGQAVANAAGNAENGDTIEVGAGSFTGSGQVVINEDLTINGAGTNQTTLLPGYNTGNSGDARGWFLVETGDTLELDTLTLDGNAPTNAVFQAIRVKGSLDADAIAFADISFSQYVGFGIGAIGGSDVDVSDSTFTNIQRVGINSFGTGSLTDSTYTGKGAGDFLDYALDLGGGAVWTVTGNTVSGNRGVASTDGSTSAGFLVTTALGAGTTASLDGNTITDNTNGIFVGFNDTDTSTVDANFNRIAGNGTGVRTTNPNVDAQNNWWGCNGGPGSAGCDTVGAGGSATGTVDADPWLVLGASANPTSVPVNGTSTITASLAGNSDGATPAGNVFPSGTPITFATTLGSIQSPVPTASPFATSTFTAGGTAGTANITAALDNQPASTAVTVNAPAGGTLGQVKPGGKAKKKCKKGKKRKARKCVKKKKKKKKRK